MTSAKQESQPQIAYEVLDNIALIEFVHGKVNAFDSALCDALSDAIDKAISHDTINAILISGQENCFSAGFNIMQLMNEKTGDELLVKGIELLIKMLECPKPIIAAACGHAIALGSIILLACDYRVGSPHHKFGMNEVTLGLPMPNFAMALGKARLNNASQHNLLLHGSIVKGQEARDAGFLDEVIGNDAVVDIALSNAQRLAKLPPVAYIETKKALYKDVIASIKKHKINDKNNLLEAIQKGLIQN